VGETFIMAGMGLNPISESYANLVEFRSPNAEKIWNEVRANYELRKSQVLEYIDTLPTHYQFLKDNIYHD
jgi:hypothetical protein